MDKTSQAVNLLDSAKFKEFIDAFNNLKTQNLPLDEVRQLCTQFFLAEDTVFEPIMCVENVNISGREGNPIPLRIFIPDELKKFPTLIYFHRGGWVFGNINEAEPICRKLANHLGCIVVAVEYRLAPENSFPKPLYDCYDATEWVAANIHQYGGVRLSLIVCGESAGGNLAAAVALMARDNQGPPLVAQLLIYPIISSCVKDTPYDNCVDKYFLTKDAMKFFWSVYIQTPGEERNPYASPDLAADFRGLPPALIITAEYDPLHAEADEYSSSLKKCGVPVQTKCYPKVIHGFLDLPIYDEKQKISWIKEIGELLNKVIR